MTKKTVKVKGSKVKAHERKNPDGSKSRVKSHKRAPHKRQVQSSLFGEIEKDIVKDTQTVSNNELDIWIAKEDLDKFIATFESLNDVKIDGIEAIKKSQGDRRYAILYRNFGGKIKFPVIVGGYQLNNHWEDLVDDGLVKT